MWNRVSATDFRENPDGKMILLCLDILLMVVTASTSSKRHRNEGSLILSGRIDSLNQVEESSD
jgi:hypothetical protein